MLLQPGSRPVPNCPEYKLIRKLGAGAFGEVWHAHGPGGLAVALKFIRLDTHVRALELRSLEVMKSIRHPNLVSLFGAWHKDNWLILAMELCDRSLQDRLAEALDQKLPGIPLEELLSCMRDAANGLDALNAKQVQHRDVKPANLLLLDSGVKVADFGLAKALEQTVASNSGAGTLAYTAPECFKGELTQQSDQYSLAVTYYHLRTGHLLFKGNQAKVMYAHLELEPDLSHLPREERVVLARALSKEPGKRWPNCKVFVNELITARQQAKETPQPTPSLRRDLDKPRAVVPTGRQEQVHFQAPVRRRMAPPQTGESNAARSIITRVEEAQSTIDLATKEYQADLISSKGRIRLTFFPHLAPAHVKNFLALAMIGFYDGLTFHRIIRNFLIQGGCPRGIGTDGAGYRIKAEFNDMPHEAGVLSMARTSDPNSASSQFFICLGRQPNLDRRYTVFGKVADDDSIDFTSNSKKQ
jgi:cyclophilin family peptidyl-prolyl cis-trans isomerase